MISDYIEKLTNIWLLWMVNHNKSNDITLSFEVRKNCGNECERLQKIRQKIILDIDEHYK